MYSEKADFHGKLRYVDIIPAFSPRLPINQHHRFFNVMYVARDTSCGLLDLSGTRRSARL